MLVKRQVPLQLVFVVSKSDVCEFKGSHVELLQKRFAWANSQEIPNFEKWILLSLVFCNVQRPPPRKVHGFLPSECRTSKQEE